MGISGNILKEFKDCRKIIALKDLKNKTMAIDVSNELYRAVTGMKNINTLTDKDNNITSHILVMIQNMIKFKSYDINQIYVFDGKPYNEKSDTLNKRKDIKNNAINKLNESTKSIQPNELVESNESNELIDIIDEDDNIVLDLSLDKSLDLSLDKSKDKSLDRSLDNEYKWNKMAFTPTKQMFDDIKFILEKFNIPYIQLPFDVECEAEQYCAYLTKTGRADYTFTSDIDAFIFGSTNVIRRENSEKKDKNGNVKKGPTIFYSYNLNEMLLNKKITYDNLIYIAISLGTDFNPNIKGFGVKTAFKKYQIIKDKFEDIHKKSYEIFTKDLSNFEVNVTYNKNNYDIKKNMDELSDWLINEKNFNKDKTFLKKVLNQKSN